MRPVYLNSGEDTIGTTKRDRTKVGTPCESDSGEYAAPGPNVVLNYYDYKSAAVSTKPWSNGMPPHPTNYSRYKRIIALPLAFTTTERSYYGSCGPDIYLMDDQSTWLMGGQPGSAATVAIGAFDTSLANKADARLLAGLAADGGSAQVGLAIVEHQKAIDLVSHAAIQIANSIRSFRKDPLFLRGGSMKQLAAIRESIRQAKLTGTHVPRYNFKRKHGRLTERERFLMEMPKKWLELQYGWKPLLTDVHDAMTTIGVRALETSYWMSKRGRAQSVAEGFIDWPAVWGSVNFSSSFPVVSRAQTEVWYTFNTSGLATVDSMGLANPASIAWELVPFSFVIDWFYDVGSFLEQFTACSGKDFMQGYRTLTHFIDPKEDTRFFVEGNFYPDPFWHSKVSPDRGGFVNYFSMVRTVLTDFPNPSPPQLGSFLGPGRIANALSLLAVAFGGGLSGNSRRRLRI